MEMIDVLQKLKEITNKSPEVKEAIKSTEAMNPKQQAAIAIAKKEKMKEHCTNFTDFLRREGGELGKMDVQDIMQMADKYAQHKIEVSKDEGVDEGMSDIHIGAQEVVGEYTDEDGNLKMPKDQVVRAMEMEKAKASFPKSYEIETAIKMVQDDFDDSGEPKPDMEPAMDAEKLNTNTMENKDKKPVNEAIQISTDSPEEAGMMMQILKLAGVKPVDAKMMGMDEPEHGSEMDPGDMNKQMDVPDDDAMGSMQMGKMRDMMMKPDMEKAEETFANSMGEKDLPKTQDVDTLVNVHSGGLNKRKEQVKKEYPGDNALAVKENTVTEEDLANSLRTQYESFKQAYQEAAKPDYIDLDKDGNKTEPMKKAAKDKEEKEKK